MNKSLFQLGQSDFIKGAFTAVFAAVITVLYGVTAQADFSIFEADWGKIVGDMIQISITTFIAYLGKNFLSDSKGEILGSAK